MREVPKFYNSIDEIKKEIFSLLSQGVKKRKSNFHNAVLSTISLENSPKSRTVVLRKFSADELTINIHSDKRAAKISEIKNNNNVYLVFYDERKKIQLRIRGVAKVEESNKESWINLSNWSRRCYLSTKSPGLESEEPTSGFSEKFSLEAPSSEESDKGLKNFALIKIFIEEIEWLFLASQGHRRALFNIKRNNSIIKIIGKWLIP